MVYTTTHKLQPDEHIKLEGKGLAAALGIINAVNAAIDNDGSVFSSAVTDTVDNYAVLIDLLGANFDAEIWMRADYMTVSNTTEVQFLMDAILTFDSGIGIHVKLHQMEDKFLKDTPCEVKLVIPADSDYTLGSVGTHWRAFAIKDCCDRDDVVDAIRQFLDWFEKEDDQ